MINSQLYAFGEKGLDVGNDIIVLRPLWCCFGSARL